ncbi:protein-disulfide reductase DsbD [Asticcacaulis sp. AND118]|uniref:protein-disulfide reductase DsbD family protein n=1 Tax=Asticcacaulis sp. AND118 TaxID=2840468 RepID=UPI001CFF9DD4|nr:thioredoxin family protein [Asticcacaulis sp. AND118]UDF03907.1 thioredoxin family protein [Asticcacaulis sp. AND118]
MLKFFASVFAFLTLCSAAQAEPVKTAHLTTELIAETTVVPGGEVWLAIRHTPLKGWHTYWQNPGDTGLAPKVTWTLPTGVTASDLVFPTPEVQPYMGLTNFGYSGETALLAQITNGSVLKDGVLPLRAQVDFLVCEKVCVPETVNLTLDLKVTPKSEALTDFSKIRAALPVPLKTDGAYAVTGDTLTLGLIAPADATAATDFAHPGGAYLFPLKGGVIDPAAKQAIELGPQGFTFALKTKSAVEGPFEAVIRFASGRSYQISAAPGTLPAAARGLGAPPAARPAINLGSVLAAMALAFVGGLILNLMPCVFPVLSMKLLALAKAGHDGAAGRRESLFYGLGVLITFALLGGLLSWLGSALGWGFQLQSPWVTAALSLLLLAVALNMSGLFEIGSGLQSLAGGRLSVNNPDVTALLTGVLAVVVAAPCTAPFMATAIGVALAQGGLVSFAIFLALGLGFALPVVALTFLITYVPAVAAKMPRPGPWMDRLRHILAVPMYGAALWMLWVFAQQVSGLGLFALVLACALLTAGLWWPRGPRVLRPVFIVMALAVAAAAAVQKPDAPVRVAVDHEAFSTARIAELRAQGKPVLVNLTAAWCVTCKVNERLVFETKAFREALKTTGTVYMVGDWTNQDAAISQYLSQNGRSGVPLYVYYGKGNADPVVLGQMLSTKDVVKVLKK